MRLFKRFLCILLATIMLIPAVNSVPAEAASTASKNKKAVKLYNKKVKSLKKDYAVNYKYVDLTGDGVKEAVFECYVRNSYGAGSDVQIYTYKNGKIKRILNVHAYGFDTLYNYKKSKGVVVHFEGHGREQYYYYKYSGGKYKTAAWRGRAWTSYSDEYGSWAYQTYSNEIGQSATKSAFNKVVKPIRKGTKKKYKVSAFTIIE